MTDYILLTLPCWEQNCPERFDVFTDLSNHHLNVHERSLPFNTVVAQPVAPPLSNLDAFRSECFAAEIAYQETAARLLLERLGVSPDAPSAGYDAAIYEAFARWQACRAPATPMAPPPPARWMWQATSQGVHDYAHAETPGCVEAGCVVIKEMP